MMKSAVLVAIFAATAFAKSVDVVADTPDINNYGLDDVFRDIIEGIRNQLKEGIPDKGIPPLDPLDMDHQAVNLTISDVMKLTGSLRKVIGNNILSFNVTKLKASMMPLSFEVGLQWEPITVRGLYDIDGHLLNIIPIYGDGSFSGEFDGVFGSLSLDIGTKAGQLRVKKFDVDFGLKHVNVNITNFLDGLLGDVICEMINENLPTMIKQFKIGYLDGIKESLVKIVNEFIKDKSAQELLDLILGMFAPTTPQPSTTVAQELK